MHDFIEIKRVLVFDERTSCMKPDLHISINVDAIEKDGKLKRGRANMHSRKIFRARLADFSKSHPEVDEIPKQKLPEPFNRLDAHSNTIKVPNPSLETPIEALGKQLLAASHLSGSFCRFFSRKVACNDGESVASSCPSATPSKEFVASARMMNVTPASRSPKRYMSPECKSSPNKLIRRLPPSRSLKFDTPGKDGIGKPRD